MQIALVDVENQSTVLKDMTQLLKKFDLTVICFSSTCNVSLALPDIMQLFQAVSDGKLGLDLVDSGKNAADIALIFNAGKLSISYPDAEFTIYSNDTCFNTLAGLLECGDHRVSIVKTTIPTPDTSVLADAKEYAKLLVKSKPAKLSTLTNNINKSTKGITTTAAVLIEKLVGLGVITIDGQTVKYNKAKLEKLANS
jgi:hypothetical protein